MSRLGLSLSHFSFHHPHPIYNLLPHLHCDKEAPLLLAVLAPACVPYSAMSA